MMFRTIGEAIGWIAVWLGVGAIAGILFGCLTWLLLLVWGKVLTAL
jgi:hypothetical protein